MIPKVIHYCWFGRGEKSKLIKKCMKSWKKYCPDYEIIEWNEDSFDINCNLFVKQAYECKMWAFVSDYARLWVLYNNGGIYLDTDVKLKKSFDLLISDKAFIGFERKDRLGSGIIGVTKKNSVIKEWLDYYSDLLYVNNGNITKEPNVIYMTALFEEKGLKADDSYQKIAGFTVYPRTYFCPIAVDEKFKHFTRNTYAVHYFSSSWRTEEELKKFKKARRRSSWWYYKNLVLIPQKIFRHMLGNERVERIKERLKIK